MALTGTDALAVVLVAAFTTAAALGLLDRRDAARHVYAASWVLFAAYWAALVPHFLFEKGSVIEGVLSAAGVPASAYVGYLLYRGRETLVTLSRGVAVMGLLYMPGQLFPAVARPMIAATVEQVEFVVRAMGYDPTMVQGKELGRELGIQNALQFTTDGHRYITEVVMACTGIGSMAIFAGLVAAVDAPWRRKLRALSVVLPVIYVLNVARVTFIALAHGHQWFRYESLAGAVAWLMGVSGTEAANRVSWYVADRIISQSLSVLALVAIALFAVRVLPELVVVFEDVLYVATGNEYDLAGALGTDYRAADGGDPPEE